MPSGSLLLLVLALNAAERPVDEGVVAACVERLGAEGAEREARAAFPDAEDDARDMHLRAVARRRACLERLKAGTGCAGMPDLQNLEGAGDREEACRSLVAQQEYVLGVLARGPQDPEVLAACVRYVASLEHQRPRSRLSDDALCARAARALAGRRPGECAALAAEVAAADGPAAGADFHFTCRTLLVPDARSCREAKAPDRRESCAELAALVAAARDGETEACRARPACRAALEPTAESCAAAGRAAAESLCRRRAAGP